MISLRSLRWPEDRQSLLALDTSFTTDRIYRLDAQRRSFILKEQIVSPPIRKNYHLADDIESLPQYDWVQIAAINDIISGIIAINFEKWNNRAIIQHLYVPSAFRGKGAGRLMVESAAKEAGNRHARCLSAETQTINYDAVRFYEKMDLH